MADNSLTLPQKLTLNERKNLTLTGVTEVVSFEDSLVVLRTALGVLCIHGQDLKLKNLSLEGGQAAVDGAITAMIFQEPAKERKRGSRWLG